MPSVSQCKPEKYCSVGDILSWGAKKEISAYCQLCFNARICGEQSVVLLQGLTVFICSHYDSLHEESSSCWGYSKEHIEQNVNPKVII